MKIGIITINDNNNYGNRLQNYALQETIKKMGIEVETIKNISTLNSNKNYILRCFKYIKIRTFDYLFKINKKRLNNFNLFDKNILFTKKLYTYYKQPNCNEYDYFIVGSDQVWNPKAARFRKIDLLCFAKNNQKISYAASFGISDFPDNIKEFAKKELNSFKNISVREDMGKKIINEMIDKKEVTVSVDPTMLISSKDWDLVSKKPQMLNTKKYILNYFLGNLSEQRNQEIERIAQENDCEIINILDKESPYYECGPSEFLYLEKNAFLICTDSFHSCVFAFIYDKPFVVFEREQKGISNMNSRIENLIHKFHLKNREYKGKITNENLEHDYSESYKILEEERKKSIKFLQTALNLDKKKE